MNKLRRQLTNCSIKSIPTDEIDYYTVVEIKNRILKLQKENEDAFNEEDVEKYIKDAKFLKRFVIKGSIEDSVRFITNILHWRKDLGLHKLSANCFPKELYTTKFIFTFEDELNGNLCVLIRGKYMFKGRANKELTCNFVSYMCYQVFERVVQKGKKYI